MRANKKMWFAVSAVLFFKPKKRGQANRYLLWENVYLVNALTPAAAQKRGAQLAKAEAGHEGITLNGKPVDVIFAGIRKIIACAANPADGGGPDVIRLKDGIEATYSEFTVRKRSDITAFVKGKAVSVVYES